MKLILENWRKFKKLNENLNETLGEIFYGAGGTRESAELDILSYFAQPESADLEAGMFKRQMPEGKKPTISELRNYLVHGHADNHASGKDYVWFRTNPVPDPVAKDWAKKLRMDLSSILSYHNSAHEEGKLKWPLPGVDLTNYMVYWMVHNDTLEKISREQVNITVKGAKRFAELMKKKQEVLPNTRQHGAASDPNYIETYNKPPPDPFNTEKFKE